MGEGLSRAMQFAAHGVCRLFRQLRHFLLLIGYIKPAESGIDLRQERIKLFEKWLH